MGLQANRQRRIRSRSSLRVRGKSSEDVAIKDEDEEELREATNVRDDAEVLVKYTVQEMARIKDHVRKYETPKTNGKAWFHLAQTLAAVFVFTVGIAYTKWAIPVLSMAIARSFVLFHDLGHRSFFGDLKFCDWNKRWAQVLAPLVCFHHEQWRTGHNDHHRVHGNKNLTDGTKTVITVREYQSLPFYQRIAYRILRSPPVFFALAPIYVFWIEQLMVPIYAVKYAAMFGTLYFIGGLQLATRFVLAQYFAFSYGTCLFHLQHQVNIGFWTEYDEENSHIHDCAQLQGSSMIVTDSLPLCYRWLLFGIEFHHIHHLSTRVPSYNMEECHKAGEKLFTHIAKVHPAQAFKSSFHTLYDEKTARYTSFPLACSLGLVD